MLNLYLYTYTLIIGHKSCTMLRILNKLTLQNFVANNAFMDKQVKHNNKQKIKYKKPFRSWELNPGLLAPKADALPLHLRFDCSQAIELSQRNGSKRR